MEDDDDDDEAEVGEVDSKIKASFIIRTNAHGYNSGRTYYFKCASTVGPQTLHPKP